jgi:hypothetical protein
VGVTAGSREVSGRKGLGQETTTMTTKTTTTTTTATSVLEYLQNLFM